MLLPSCSLISKLKFCLKSSETKVVIRNNGLEVTNNFLAGCIIMLQHLIPACRQIGDKKSYYSSFLKSPIVLSIKNQVYIYSCIVKY